MVKASHQGFCRLLLVGLTTSQNSRTLLRLARVVAAEDAVRSTTAIPSVIITKEGCEQGRKQGGRCTFANRVTFERIYSTPQKTQKIAITKS